MNLKMLVAVSGKQAGVYKVIGNRNDGLIAEDLATKKREYIPQRGNQFTPLESISIYTEDDTVMLSAVFTAMKASELPLPEPKAADAVLREYFTAIVPDHDQYRVYISDIRKVVKWFTKLDALGLLEEEPEEAAAETDAPEA
jgi:glutamate/tyrosine decarboxylase-like PLP-dependent enzyme